MKPAPRQTLLRLDRSAEEDRLKDPVDKGDLSDAVSPDNLCVAGMSTPRQGGTILDLLVCFNHQTCLPDQEPPDLPLILY